MLIIFSMSIPDYTDNIVLFMGIAVLGVNLGRAYVAPRSAKIMSKEKKTQSTPDGYGHAVGDISHLHPHDF